MAEVQDFRLSPHDALLAVVDVQERLMAAMDAAVKTQTVNRVLALAQAAERLGMPVVVTEQYPKGLGPTLAEVAAAIPEFRPIEKLSFSCLGAEGFLRHLQETGRTKVILTGAETHVCCYQTALDLLEAGYIVHVVADALCSRRKLNWRIGLAAMEKAGAIPTTAEQVLFDLLRTAGTEDFKTISKLVK